MATVLERFKHWIFASRSFIFSWYTKDRNQLQQPTESLLELPPSLREKLIAATQELADNPQDTQAIRTSIDEAFEQWRDRRENAENSIVILTSPVMVVSRILIEILETWAAQKQISVKILPWNGRPVDIETVQPNLQQYLEPEETDTGTKQPEVMVIPNLSWCFLRSMDGLDGIEYLQNQLLHDSSRFWIIATGQVSWDYLNSISHIEADCGQVSHLPKLASDSLSQWLQPIVKELNIAFAKPKLDPKLLDGDKTPEDIYFEHLASVSQGISVIALQVFLASIRFEPSEAAAKAGKVKAQSPELPKLPDLEPSDHYLLYFLLLHGDITLAALAYSIGDDLSLVRKRIKFLRSKGLVEQQGDTLKVNPIYYPKLKQELLNNNFVINEFE